MERAEGSRAVAEVKLLCRPSRSPYSPGPLGLVTGPGRGWPWKAVVWGGDSGVRRCWRAQGVASPGPLPAVLLRGDESL